MAPSRPSLQALRAETMVDSLPRASTFWREQGQGHEGEHLNNTEHVFRVQNVKDCMKSENALEFELQLANTGWKWLVG